MKILAIMQNQWFKNPQRMEKMLVEDFKGDRPRFVKTWLFWSCLTGKRLQKVFGEAVCDDIIWEEASPKIGGFSSAKFPPDPQHIAEAIRAHKPDVILTFGVIARDGVVAALPKLGNLKFAKVIHGPHPVARHGSVISELESMRLELVAVGAIS